MTTDPSGVGTLRLPDLSFREGGEAWSPLWDLSRAPIPDCRPRDATFDTPPTTYVCLLCWCRGVVLYGRVSVPSRLGEQEFRTRRGKGRRVVRERSTRASVLFLVRTPSRSGPAHGTLRFTPSRPLCRHLYRHKKRRISHNDVFRSFDPGKDVSSQFLLLLSRTHDRRTKDRQRKRRLVSLSCLLIPRRCKLVWLPLTPPTYPDTPERSCLRKSATTDWFLQVKELS